MMPLWKYLPASVAHDLAPIGLRITAELFGKSEASVWHGLDWRGLHFPNRMGIAGGVDKDAEQCLDWQKLGAGFCEVGTITPLAQEPNPGKIMDRDWEHGNLWNKMGFPSEGMGVVAVNLERQLPKMQIPVFANIGRNRETSDSLATRDYEEVLLKMAPLVSGFVVNVSSPNTKGLRSLQTASSLGPMCERLVTLAGKKPVLVKLSPDQSATEMQESLDAAATAGVSGFVLTNTTLSRPNGSPFPAEGGLSGEDLRALSELKLKSAVQLLGTRKRDFLLISAGGISSIDDVKKRLDLGADLLEVYSALVFKGPRFFQSLKKEWET